jgi:hypothetical protein
VLFPTCIIVAIAFIKQCKEIRNKGPQYTEIRDDHGTLKLIYKLEIDDFSLDECRIDIYITCSKLYCLSCGEDMAMRITPSNILTVP